MARHGIFPQLQKNEDKFDKKSSTATVAQITQDLPKLLTEKPEAVGFPEISDRTISVGEFAKQGNNPMLPLDKQLVRKLWERRLILDAFSLENPSLASTLLVEGHPSLAAMMVTGESEGRSSRGQGGGEERGRGGIGRGEVRFPDEVEKMVVGEKAKGEARFNLGMDQLELLLDALPGSQPTFRRWEMGMRRNNLTIKRNIGDFMEIFRQILGKNSNCEYHTDTKFVLQMMCPLTE